MDHHITFEKWKNSSPSVTEYSTQRLDISDCSLKFTAPKPYQQPTTYKKMRPFIEDLDTLNEVMLRNETIKPKTKYLTLVEINCNS